MPRDFCLLAERAQEEDDCSSVTFIVRMGGHAEEDHSPMAEWTEETSVASLAWRGGLGSLGVAEREGVA